MYQYEIEMKALLTEEQYIMLVQKLPAISKEINIETMHTTRFRPGDLRVRHSEKRNEIIFKDGDATTLSRKEITIPIESKEQLDKFEMMFKMLKYQADPSWTKHKKEYEYEYKGVTYVFSLQNIQNFAKILEVEVMADSDQADLYEDNMKAIIRDLGLEPINKEEFKEKIKDYIKNN